MALREPSPASVGIGQGMTMQWDVRLEGGPADGDQAVCDGPLPPKVFTTFCDGCKDWHWFSEPTRGAEVYSRESSEDGERTAKYIYTDLDTTGPERDERGRGRREPVLA